MKGEPGTSFPATSTVTLWGPSSVGANVVSNPSGVFLSGSSEVWFLGVVTLTVHGTSSPTGAVFTDTGRLVLTCTANGENEQRLLWYDIKIWMKFVYSLTYIGYLEGSLMLNRFLVTFLGAMLMPSSRLLSEVNRWSLSFLLLP